MVTLCRCLDEVCLLVFAVVSVSVGKTVFTSVDRSKMNAAASVKGQPMRLVPTGDDAFTWGSDAPSHRVTPEVFTIAGDLVQPVVPKLYVTEQGTLSSFDVASLKELLDDMWQELGTRFKLGFNAFPNVTQRSVPCTRGGACAVVSEIGSAYLTIFEREKVTCPVCDKETSPANMRAHIGLHILSGGAMLERPLSERTCGFCGKVCTIGMKGKGTPKSPFVVICEQCPMYRKFSYNAAISEKSKCTNVPMHCDVCTDAGVADSLYWKYNMGRHYEARHKGVPLPRKYYVNAAAEMGRISKARLR
eukprot:GHVU01157266.1.p1 GENE.GHVU01157266.1~~GHVU01157266.1.p1  ORF type:complete len:304 (-),score=30.22 GHVU01157266.1:132-1043(-)